MDEQTMKEVLTTRFDEPVEEYFGFYFRRSIGMMYKPNGEPTGFVFEDQGVSLPDATGAFHTIPTSPLAYATKETAEAIRRILEENFGGLGYTFTLTETKVDSSPFTRNKPERQIIVTQRDTGREVMMNAGLLANQMMRQPDGLGLPMLRDGIASLFM